MKRVAKGKFVVEFWTKICGSAGERDMYAVIMPSGYPCAFGSKDVMDAHAKRLNDNNGVLAKLA